MPRSRNIKPGYFTNDRLAELPPLTRILFAGLWTIADREGRLEDRPKRIRALVLPYDDYDVDAALDALADGPDPFLVRYEADGQRCVQILAWERHQSPHHKEEESQLPSISQASGKHEPSMVQARSKHDASKSQATAKHDNLGSHAPVSGIRNQESAIKEEDALESVRDDTVRAGLSDWIAYKAEQRQAYKPRSLKALVTRTNSLADEHGPQAVCEAMQRAMAAGWKGYEHGLGEKSRAGPSRTNPSADATARFLASETGHGEQRGDGGGGQLVVRQPRPQRA